MGISGLIPFVEQATEQTTLLKFKGLTAAIDSYCLLHKGSYSVADKLVKNIPKITAHIDYCMKYVDMLLRLGIRPIMVFDGKNLPAKAMTEKNRREIRDAAKKKAQEFMRAGKMSEARKEFVKAVDITHEHAVQLMKECRKIGVDCITAMYEADAQLAYLNKIKLADLVISEDSDLILFGCKRIIFKLKLDATCLHFDASKLHLTLGVSEEKFIFDKFRRICILSGCDYLNSLHGIGLGKAKKFMLMTEETDMAKSLPKLPSYLNMKKLEVTPEYIDGFLKAEATFKHMYVYDPVKREMLRLNPLDTFDNPDNCVNAGELLSPRISYQLALGNLNPRTDQPVDDFNPDTQKLNPKHRSIWSQTMFTKKSFALLSPVKKHAQLVEVQNIIEQENDVTTEVEIDDLVASYTEVPSTKRRNSDEENKEVEFEARIETPSRNPFAKRHQPETKKLDAKPSLLNKFTSFSKFQSESRVVSRFFTSSEKLDKAKEMEQDEEDARKLSLLIKTVTEERERERKRLYDAVRMFEQESMDEGCGTMETDGTETGEIEETEMEAEEEVIGESKETPSQDEEIEATQQEEEKATQSEEVVDLDSYQFKPQKSQKQTFITGVKPKPSKPKPTATSKKKPTASKQKSQESSVQMRLSAFGFQKQTTMSLSQTNQ